MFWHTIAGETQTKLYKSSPRGSLNYPFLFSNADTLYKKMSFGHFWVPNFGLTLLTTLAKILGFTQYFKRAKPIKKDLA